ncbi:endo alpha-1,4 polygalactosaminidase [Deinococcus misasensis]|uniref:endo alpha-1,4 polygalactosaminidase n=1 Tax=Deinococcus misasensis TaxID=392413 RepID=UPI0006920C7D|nr:endo alpha-1,4 polygalactosaminidase [Deinococcus misasensis]
MKKLVSLLCVVSLVSCAQTLSAETPSRQAVPDVFASPQVPRSWDYRIAQVLTSSASQVVSQDAWNATPSSVASLHAASKAVLCYFSAGTWEYDNFSRLNINKVLTNGSGNLSEAQAVSLAIQAGKSSYTYGGQTRQMTGDQLTFKKLAGSQLPGWDEYVYKIAGFTASSSTAEHILLRRILTEHMQRVKTLGCEAIEPDNIDAHKNVSGITATDQYNFNVWLANTAHSMGLKILLKNDLGQIADGAAEVPAGKPGLARIFDGIINEECFKYQECGEMKPFRDLNKPIFVREYLVTNCTTFKSGRYSSSDTRTRVQVASSLKLNVSGSKYDNGGSPDANANPTTCAFGTW